MGTGARWTIRAAIPAAIFMLTLAGAGTLHAGDSSMERYVCPLRQVFDPGDGTGGIFSASGPFAGDFRLLDVRRRGLTNFLDTTRADYTFFYFLDSTRKDTLLNLNALERLRNRAGGRIGLTVVFLDRTDRDTIEDYLDSHRLSPDFVLHDPNRTQPRCYSFDSPSVLHVVGPQGRIILTASDRNPVDLTAFTEAVEGLLSRNCGYSSFAEARGIYNDAIGWIEKDSPELALIYLERVLELQPQLYTINRLLADIHYNLGRTEEAARYYGRYLAAGDAYDTEEIRENLRALAAAGRVTP